MLRTSNRPAHTIPAHLVILARRRAPVRHFRASTYRLAVAWCDAAGLGCAWCGPVARLMESDGARIGWTKTLVQWGIQ